MCRHPDGLQAPQEREEAVQEPEPLRGSSATASHGGTRTWQAERLGEDLEEHADRAAHLQQAESRANAQEHLARAGHDPDAAEAARGQAQAARQARLNAEAEAYDTAAALQETALGEMPAEPSPADADRDAPDHLYGSPECAEADPETAHFGTGPGEPQDAGQPAASFATHGHQMYPQMLAGLREGHAEIAQHMGQAGEYPHACQMQYQAEAC